MTELLIASIVSALGALFKAFRFVHEGELGIKLRFGKALRDERDEPIIIPPGFVWLVPFVDTLKRHHVRQQTINFPSQRIMITDGLIFFVSAMVILKVEDIYKALFEIDELENSVGDLCMAVLRDELQGYAYTDFSTTEKISQQLLAKLQERAKMWGIRFLQFSLTDCAPTPETANVINIRVAARLKAEALKESLTLLGLDPQSAPATLSAALVGIPLTLNVGDGQAVPETDQHNGRHADLTRPKKLAIRITGKVDGEE